MSSPNVEIIMARLYSDTKFLDNFIKTPETCIETYELSESEKTSILGMNREDLAMAAVSYNNKRNRKKHKH